MTSTTIAFLEKERRVRTYQLSHRPSAKIVSSMLSSGKKAAGADAWNGSAAATMGVSEVVQVAIPRGREHTLAYGKVDGSGQLLVAPLPSEDGFNDGEGSDGRLSPPPLGRAASPSVGSIDPDNDLMPRRRPRSRPSSGGGPAQLSGGGGAASSSALSKYGTVRR